MANNSDYVPSNKDEFLKWLKNFLKQATASVNHYGINQEQIKKLEELVALLEADIQNEQDLLNQKLAQFKETAKDISEAEAYSRKMAQQIKNSMDYTDKVGREFEIIAPESPFDPKTYQPTIAVRRVSSGIEVSFSKSETEGVNIYRCKKGDADFEFLAYDLHSPYVDTKDMTETVVYEYYVRGVIKGQEIGQKSLVAIITV